MTRKRTCTAAFAEEPAETTPGARPIAPLRQKRSCVPARPTRPSFLTEAASSPLLSSRLSPNNTLRLVLPGRAPTPPTTAHELLAPTSSTSIKLLTFQSFSSGLLETLEGVLPLLEPLNAQVYGVTDTGPTAAGRSGWIVDEKRSLAKELGLLHPLGGGRECVDAVVVVDAQGRWRGSVVVGFGEWRGEGLLMKVVGGVEWLANESAQRSRTSTPKRDGRREECVEVEMGGMEAGGIYTGVGVAG